MAGFHRKNRMPVFSLQTGYLNNAIRLISNPEHEKVESINLNLGTLTNENNRL